MKVSSDAFQYCAFMLMWVFLSATFVYTNSKGGMPWFIGFVLVGFVVSYIVVKM